LIKWRFDYKVEFVIIKWCFGARVVLTFDLGRRSPFNKISVMNMRAALQKEKWRASEKFKVFMKKRYGVHKSTILVEESIGTANNHKEIKKCRKYRRPERSTQRCL